jgi:hypothetical protein
MITNTWRTAGSPEADREVDVDPPPAVVVVVDTDNDDPEEQAVMVRAMATRIPAPALSRRRGGRCPVGVEGWAAGAGVVTP